MSGLAFILAGLVVAQAAPGQQYDHAARAAYLEEALVAMRETELQTLENAYRYIQAMERNACVASSNRLRINCLVEKARKSCKSHKQKAKRAACARYSDLIVVNAMATHHLISKEKRFTIMQSQGDFRLALRRELTLLHGQLAAEFRLAPGFNCSEEDAGCLAAAVDSYCMAHTDRSNIAWQYCTAGLVWFIGSAGRSE